MQSVKEELDRMERLGVISPVEAPHGLVCWHGSCAEIQWPSQDMCGSHKVK